MGNKVLEIGTGSGYQSAYLSNLTDQVWTIEIIKPLAERTRGVYEALIQRGYSGPPGAQHILKVLKEAAAGDQIAVNLSRSQARR